MSIEEIRAIQKNKQISAIDQRRSAESITGNLKITGPRYAPPPKWEINVICKPAQIDLFEALMEAQRVTDQAISLQDRFGADDANTIWVDVDDRYLGTVAGCQWWQLQFTAYREV